MVKNPGRPIHGVICKEDEIKSIIYYKTEKLPTQKSKQANKFTEDEIEELCRP